MELWVGLALGLAVAIIAIRWWLNHPRPAILGQDDLSDSIHQMLRWADDGARFKCTALDRDAVVVFTRLAGTGQEVPIELEIASGCFDENRATDLGSELESFGVSLLSQPMSTRDAQGRGTWHATAHLPVNAKDCGPMADLLLRAAGLPESDRYRYRFEGSVSADRLRQDAIEQTHMAGAKAPREWQASLLRRMSKSLRATRGKDMKDREPRG